jgi:6-phosphogluconolactonase
MTMRRSSAYPSAPHEYVFASRDEMLLRAEQDCIAIIRNAAQDHPAMTLLLSGGTTPLPLYRYLAQSDLPWDRLHVALVDERWVDETDAASNARAVREALFETPGSKASGAQFVAMKTRHARAAEAREIVEEHYRALPPVALCVLGMGADGHVASWFPEAQGLDRALNSDDFCADIIAQRSSVTGEHVERMTITRRMLARSQHIVLLLTGLEKWRTLTLAKQIAATDADARVMPVSLLFGLKQPVDIYFSR